MRSKLWFHVCASRVPEQVAMGLVENGWQTPVARHSGVWEAGSLRGADRFGTW